MTDVNFGYKLLKHVSIFTVTIATPGVFSLTAHGYVAGDIVIFSTTGALPTGLSAGVRYYVIAGGLTANAFEVSTTSGGSAVNTTGSQSGVHKVGVTVGEVTSLTPPEFGQGKVETTHHASANREYIPDGLVGFESFESTISLAADMLYDLLADMTAKTISAYSLLPPTITYDLIHFNGFPEKVSPGQADAQNPGLLQADVLWAVADTPVVG